MFLTAYSQILLFILNSTLTHTNFKTPNTQKPDSKATEREIKNIKTQLDETNIKKKFLHSLLAANELPVVTEKPKKYIVSQLIQNSFGMLNVWQCMLDTGNICVYCIELKTLNKEREALSKNVGYNNDIFESLSECIQKACQLSAKLKSLEEQKNINLK